MKIETGFFLSFLFVFVIVFISLFCLLNYLVDPWGALRKRDSGYYFSQERFLKPMILRNQVSDCVILGSSKSTYINPDDFPELNCINLGISGVRPEELLLLLQDEDLKQGTTLILGLDLYMFGDQVSVNPGLSLSRNHFYYLTSRDVLIDSFKIVTKQFHDLDIQIATNGSRVFDPATDVMASDEAKVQAFIDDNFSDFRVSQKRIQLIRSIKRLTESRGLPLLVFISPETDPVQHKLVQSGVIDQIKLLKSNLQDIFPDLVDFTCFSSFTRRDAFLKSDPVHYLPSTGKKMLEQLLLEQPRVIDEC